MSERLCFGDLANAMERHEGLLEYSAYKALSDNKDRLDAERLFACYYHTGSYYARPPEHWGDQLVRYYSRWVSRENACLAYNETKEALKFHLPTLVVY